MKIIKNILLILLALGFTEVYAWMFVPKIKIGPSFKVPDAELGLRMKRDASGRRWSRDYDMRWTTGDQGFRGASYTQDKPDHTLRAISIGNSNAFGVGVDDDQTYAVIAEHALQGRLPEAVQIINAGSTDAGTGEFLRRFDELMSFHPDALVFRYDFYNFKDPESQYTFPEGGAPVPRQHRSAGGLGKLYDRIDASPLAYSGALSLLRWRLGAIQIWMDVALCRLPRPHTANEHDPCLPINEDDDGEEYQLLDLFLARAHEAQVPVVFLLFDLRSAERDAKVRQVLAHEDVVDLTHLHEKPGYTFRYDPHMTVPSHAETGQILADELTKLWSR